MSKTTSTMQPFGIVTGAGMSGSAGLSAGLVLLFSEIHRKLQPAYPFTTAQVVIGRDASCTIVVPEPAVSRRHASISFNGHSWILRDLGGANGTIVDGRMVREVELQHLHEIRVGDTLLKFVARGAEHHCNYCIDGTMRGHATRRAGELKELVGGWAIDRIGEQLRRIAGVELSVIIEGESGTGKEIVARELHAMSGRPGPLHAINCAAIPPNLIESELFGYKRGAFSSADRDKPGLISAADRGTLLLDEIGDMPLEAQAKLLRVIQTREVYPVGSTNAQRVDVRFVAATNRNLSHLVKTERFRGDLLARLNEYSINLAPLRERKEDIYQLSRAFIKRHGYADKRLSFALMLALIHYDWPYNVRELESCLRRCCAMSEGNDLNPAHLPDAIREAMVGYASRTSAGCDADSALLSSRASGPVARGLAPTEQQLRDLLELHRGNVAAVGRELGKERMQIHRWMQRYDIRVEDYRRP